MPVSPGTSFNDPALYVTCTSATGRRWSSWTQTRKPLGSSNRVGGVAAASCRNRRSTVVDHEGFGCNYDVIVSSRLLDGRATRVLLCLVFHRRGCLKCVSDLFRCHCCAVRWP